MAITVVVLLVIILGTAVVSELVIKLNRPTAVVNGVEISIRAWQQRVRLDRARFILYIEALEAELDGDLGQVQEQAQEEIELLYDAWSLGEIVLKEMVDEELIRQAAASRGITVSLEESWPVTAVALRCFNQPGSQADDPVARQPGNQAADWRQMCRPVLRRLTRWGIREATYRQAAEARIYREKLMVALAAEAGNGSRPEQLLDEWLVRRRQGDAVTILDAWQDHLLKYPFLDLRFVLHTGVWRKLHRPLGA